MAFYPRGAFSRVAAMTDQTTITIMVNACYGGFGLSEAAMDEYRRRRPSSDVGVAGGDAYYDIARHDALMVQVVKELGHAANGPCAAIELWQIPSRYVNHYSIREYDGMENVAVHRNAYRVDAAREILRQETLTKTEKLARLAAVMKVGDD
jgi:hypothetical protein